MKNKTILWIIVALLTPFTPYIDLFIERFFYDGGFSSDPFYLFIYDYGFYPAWLVALPALFLFLFYKEWRQYALYLVIVLAVGAGFIVHTTLKDHWGRPRPKQVIEFGGKQEFRPFYQPNFFHQPEPSKSFPCGHCSVGFYFLSLVFLGNRLKKRWLSATGWILGITLGTLLGITRMAMGGHFFTDVLWSGIIMWLTALISDWLLFEEDK